MNPICCCREWFLCHSRRDGQSSGEREECAAVGCPELPTNAGGAAASLGENGNVHLIFEQVFSQCCPLPPVELCALSKAGAQSQGTAQSFHVRAKHSISTALPTALTTPPYCSVLSSLNSSCCLQGWSLPELFYRQTSGCWVRGSPAARPPAGDGFAFVQLVGGHWPVTPSYPFNFPWASLLADISAEAEGCLQLILLPSDVLI